MSPQTPPGDSATNPTGQINGGTAPAGSQLCGNDMLNAFLAAGVRLPEGRTAGSADRYVYLDSNGNPQEVQVCFQWNNPSAPEGAGNVMIVSGLTPELARMLDQMVDGKPDAQEGRFRLQGVDNGTANAPGVQWNRTNDDTAASLAGAEGDNLQRDESQVVTVVAVYKMNQ